MNIFELCIICLLVFLIKFLWEIHTLLENIQTKIEKLDDDLQSLETWVVGIDDSIGAVNEHLGVGSLSSEY